MNKKLLTQKIVEECICGVDNGKQNSKVITVLAIIMFIVGTIGLVFPLITVICYAIGVLCIILINKSRQIIKNILNKNYTLQKDICTRKGISHSTEGPDTNYLLFANAGRCDLSFSHAVVTSEAVRTVSDLYASTEANDSFYLLQTPGKPFLFIFNSKFWALNEEEFNQSNNIYIPKKAHEQQQVSST